MHQNQPNNDFDKYDEPRLHMERLLRTRLTEFDISAKILYPLADAGIKTLGDLISHSANELMQINRIGITAVHQLERFLEYHLLSLKK